FWLNALLTRRLSSFASFVPYSISIFFAFMFCANSLQFSWEKSWYRCFISEVVHLSPTFGRSSWKYGDSEHKIRPEGLTLVDAINAIIAPKENPNIYFCLLFIFLYFLRKYWVFSEIVLSFQGMVTNTGLYPSLRSVWASIL